MLRALGADRVIDNTREDATRGERRYDFLFDVPANRPFSAWRRALTADAPEAGAWARLPRPSA